MKIFPTNELNKISDANVTEGRASLKRTSKNKKQKALAEKQPLSESEIREKLAAHVETSNTAKSATLKKNSQKMGEGFMNADAKPVFIQKTETKPEAESEKENDPHLLKTDINLNDPKDPATQEKLKTVLSSGAFNFNANERETLNKILSGN